MSELSNPHDHFFKETFSRPEAARSFLQNYLPPQVVAELDLDTLVLRKDSFIDPDLQQHFSDFDEIFPGPAALRPYWPSFRYELTDLSTYSDAEIEGSAFLQIGLTVLKHIYDPNLGERLPALSALFRRLANTETALEYLRTVLIYVAAANDRVTESDLATAVDTALPQRRGDIMPTLVEKWIEQGKQEGLELGLEKGLERGLQQGREQGLEQSILRLLTRRFGPPPPSVTAELEALSAPALERVLDAAIEAPDMEAFTSRLASIVSAESA